MMINYSILVCCLVCSVNLAGYSQNTDVQCYCTNEKSIGLGGYDAVSYFLPGGPEKGKENINASYDGVVYNFTTKANKEKFLSDPLKFLPQFGGWCSMTLAMGRTTTPTYDNFSILGGKLYLFERTLSVNGRELWRLDPTANESKASKNYETYCHTGKIK